MPWQWPWVSRSFRATDGDAISSIYGDGSDWADETVNLETARKLSAWWQCDRLYADVTGTLPFKVYRRTANDDRVQDREHPVAQIISMQPNADNTTQEFWSAYALHLRSVGNAYAERSTTAGGRLIALQILPCDTQPYRDFNGDLRYRFIDRGKREDVPREKVFHTRAFYDGGDLGLSPLTAARRTLSTAMATERAVAQTFSKGMRSKGFFVTPTALTKDQREQAHKALVVPFSGAKGKDWGILEGGFDVKTVNIPPKDAEMLLNRRYSVEDICRFKGTPPILVGHSAEGQTMWGTGVESIVLSWRTLGLDAHLSTIEKAINRWLFTPAERITYYAEIDRDGLVQADSKARAELIGQMVQYAQLTPNEGRRKMNREALPGGDQLFINSTMMPLPGNSAVKETQDAS